MATSSGAEFGPTPALEPAESTESHFPAPSISVGMPVYNGGAGLAEAIESVLAQTFPNFELIISDNASSDETQAICERFAAQDRRVRYHRQPVNIGAAANFKRVFELARGEYFMWAAADDIRSVDFLQANHSFLAEHPDYVASSSPSAFGSASENGSDLVRFSLEGDRPDRICGFFDHCWQSHGLFYSLIRRDALAGCEEIGAEFLATDWAIDLHLASRGKFATVESGLTVFGVKGISRGANPYKTFRRRRIEAVLPFYELSLCVFRIARDLPVRARIGLGIRLLGLNLKANLHRLKLSLRG